MVLGFSCSRE